MRKKIVAGNWKMNMNLQDGVALAKEINEALVADKPNCDVVICTPFIHLASVAQVLDSEIVGLGAENCADKAKGAFTGEVSAEMVKSGIPLLSQNFNTKRFAGVSVSLCSCFIGKIGRAHV